MIAKRLIIKIVLSLLVLGAVPVHGVADVRIILDVSKSMAENDPQNFRTDAIELLLNAIPNGEKAGVWTFGQYVNLLVPHEVVTNTWRANALARVRSQNAPAVRTNIGRALEDASYDFLFSTYRGPTHVVVITDGKVDIAPNNDVNQVERERIINQLIPKYAAANAIIHTIAISDQSDQSLLRQMSQQTGGQYQPVLDTQNLSRVLSSVAAEVSPANQIKLAQKSFDVDESIREITVLMYHNQGSVSLIAPNGSETSAVNPLDQRWRVGQGFTQVSISSPMTGRWQVKGDLNENSNIRVMSDVNIQWLSPDKTTVNKGSALTIEATVSDDHNKPITDDLSQLITASLWVNGAPAAVQVHQDKIVARIFAPANAEYVNLELNVDGGTFSRIVTRQVRFVEPYTSEVLMMKDGYEWRIYPNSLLASVENINATAQYSRNNQPVNEPFTQTNAGYWVWKLPYSADPGVYEVQLNGELSQQASTVLLSKESIELTIPPAQSAGLPMTPELALPSEPMKMPGLEGEFVKDPMPDFKELEAERVIDQTPENTQWSDEPIEGEGEPSSNGSDMSILSYILLSVPGLLVLVAAYLFYRRLEQKSKGASSEEEFLMGGDDFSQLDDMDALKPDSDLDISSLDLDDDDGLLPEAPVIDDVVTDEDLPTPERTEAPTLGQEDMLDSSATDTEFDPEEELFDIGSIDDDLADLDLALDGDDPFADEDEDLSKP